ncbi:MAG: phytanoyl-CoA dioxygenase family protein [Candidatus Dormibacteria bacterium]
MAKIPSLPTARFRRNGYVVLSGLVPDALINLALRAVNESLGHGVDPSSLDEFRNVSFCPELRTSAPITDLVKIRPVRAAVESLIGPGFSTTRPQIALRFPAADDMGGGPPHIDACPAPGTAVEPGTAYTFSLLVGVFLSELRTNDEGNFTVWPGTHRTYGSYFKQHGAERVLDGIPRVPLPKPRQLRARPGDVLVAHHQLGHSFDPNRSPNIRYAVYFRVRSANHVPGDLSVLEDIWRDFRTD